MRPIGEHVFESCVFVLTMTWKEFFYVRWRLNMTTVASKRKDPYIEPDNCSKRREGYIEHKNSSKQRE
jgi:hypothetical protein